jgi:transcriptional regulator with XRE-family HTH domain
MIPHNKGAAGPYKEPKTDLIVVSYQLRKVRYQRGLSLNALSALSGYSSKTIQGWENGHFNPSVPAVIDWANTLGFDIVLRDRSTGHILTPLGGRVKV